MKKIYFYNSGKRKSSSARIFAKNGKGIIYINKKIFQIYFQNKKHRQIILQPLKISHYYNKLNFFITVKGGGTSGQTEAIRHGITRLLIQLNSILKPILKKAGLVTRDSRVVERKKIGRHKSRKKPQFSKR